MLGMRESKEAMRKAEATVSVVEAEGPAVTIRQQNHLYSLQSLLTPERRSIPHP
jgi:hypothetical protein